MTEPSRNQRIVGPLAPPYYVVVFTSLRTDGDGGYEQMSGRMVELAAEQEGFLGVESVREGDFGITVSYWSSEEAIRGWRMQVEHLDAQRRGREKWYRAFAVHVAKVERTRTFGMSDE